MLTTISLFRKKFKTLPPDRVVRCVAQGYRAYTQVFLELEDSASDTAYLQRLVEAGLLTTVLQLLERCHGEKFSDVLGRNGDLPNPGVWLSVLLNSILETGVPNKETLLNSRMEIARGIGPVVRCMIDDRQRMFFDEKKYWWQGPSIVSFFGILENLTYSLETVPVLVEYEGLTEFLVQSIFWESHRPDIVADTHKYASFIPPDTFRIIQESAIAVLYAFVNVGEDGCSDEEPKFSDEEAKKMKRMASTKIVSELYNPDCKVTFVAGWFDLMKAGPSEQDSLRLWSILLQLMAAQCVDRKLIVRLVEYGTSNVTSYNDALYAVAALYDALVPPLGIDKGKRKPNDDLFSVAIKAGLIEMSLKMIVRFGASGTKTLLNKLGLMLNDLSAVSLFKKSAKAVSEHRSEILDVLRTMVGKTEGKSSELVEKVRSIVSINTETGKKTNSSEGRVLCMRCLQTFPADQMKKCSKCQKGRSFH